MAGKKRFPVHCRGWNDYCCGFQWTTLECVPHYQILEVVWPVTNAFTPDVLPLNAAASTIRRGLYGGLAFGLAQDALGLARGRRLGYVDFLLGRNQDALTEILPKDTT